MGILRNIIAKNYSLSDFNRDFNTFYYGGSSSKAGVRINEESAMRFSAVHACVQAISEDVGMLPAELRKWRDIRDHSKGSDPALDHPLYEVLANEPNTDMNAMIFGETLQAHVLLSGNGYAYKYLDRRGRVIKLQLLDWHCMSPKRNDAGDVVYEYTDGTTKLTFEQWEVFHIPGLGFDGIVGRSPIKMAMEAIGLGMAQEEFAERFFSNGANLGGFITMDAAVKDKDGLKKEFEDKFAGLGKAHKVLFLESGMTFQRLVMPLQEAQFIEGRKMQVEEVARIYRVPLHIIQHLEHSTYCLPANTEIFTEYGPKAIIDVMPEEKVWSLNKAGELSLARVLHNVCNGEDEIIEIKTTNRTICANAAHRILTRRKHADPKPGCGGYQHITWKNEYVPAGELNIGDTIVSLEFLPDGGTNQAPTRIATKGFMEFCGLLLGDGNVQHGWGVSIARSNKASYMDHYRDVMRAEFVSFGRNGNGKHRNLPTIPVNIKEYERQTNFASILAAEELTVLGFSGTAYTKAVPGWVFNLTTELKLAFIRGYLDADGTVDKKGRIKFSSVNIKMLSQFRHLCMSVRVPVTNMDIQKSTVKLPSGKLCTYKLYSFTCSDPGQNRLIWSHDVRYQARLLAGKKFSSNERNYPRHGGKGFDIDGCGLTRIKSIKKQPLEPVYDLEVEGSHNFIANGILVHNSNVEHQDLEYTKHTLLPWIRRWEQAIDTRLLTRYDREDGYFSMYKIDELLRGDSKTRAEVNHIKRQDGVITANEWRSADDQNPRFEPEADKLIINGNMREISIVNSGTGGKTNVLETQK